ncbi:hypothetical protein BKA67DRAFT_626167 [Truncatella angustata]|uniref:GPI inositol-deacylase n=1 Tax=Truncatella angustata TaxID=152316 RepID=A0A9P8ZWA2_9PEZI|nr:uncharacterized protein BKA67DRAFT_626167 [Truncatella angustata]KAH6651738.1 hypothetical protein BKA67DRAFT_626167 [Truncatella angustata]
MDRHASTGESLSLPLSVRSGGSFFGSIIRKETKDADRKEAPKGTFGLTTLYEPPSVDVPVADLVFVHGLNGGSQSTWTKGDESNFWPKHWLPNDDAFTDVRIHTFGYHSGLRHESILGIRDFSHSLLGAIQDAPTIPRRQSVPLILVGHSMGGLVIKQALVLAHQLHEFKSLADRICAMFFLGVPHQGAEIAHTLNRVLSLHGVRPFVHELYPSSSILAAINKDFPYLSKDLRLFSFFETKPMNYGIGKGLIVERQAAVLNYINERRIYLDANHRDVARFPSVNDPSYLTIRNALATLIDSLREPFQIQSQPEGDDDETTSETEKEMQKNIIANFLGVKDAPEGDYMTLDATRLPGSCEWLLQKPTFVEWRETNPSKAFWLQGRPGAGKSVISSAVISSLRWLTRDCCFFFFVRADKNKSSIKSFLRSMAFQMAMLHPEIRQAILEIIPKWGEGNLEKDDAIVVWRKLFVTGILKIRLKRPQYWVVDALDEANGGSNMITFLSKAKEYWPLGIFVTSRTSIDTHIGPLGLKMEVISNTITEEDNTGDIYLFLELNYERFPASTSHARKEMAHRILQNSKGCFLWAQLIVKELVQVQTMTQANQVIDSNPSDMEALYLRITKEMSEQRFNQELVKAILVWAVCSVRPLHLDELQQAIQTDINDEIGDMERSISESCGNLVYVDNSRKLQLLHLTVREFLTKDNIEFGFKVDKSLGHRRLAMVCLDSLLGQNMKRANSSTTTKSGTAVQGSQTSPFAEYATDYLFHHLAQTKSYDDELILALTSFLKSTNLLTWIELVAKRSDLRRIYQAGKTINHILHRRAQSSPPVGLHEERDYMGRCANDLIHLVTKFGKRLITSPYAIFNLIPPFFPESSAIRQQFCTPRSLTIHGTGAKGWDDCLSTMSYVKPIRPQMIATSHENMVLGTSTGQVIMYDQATFQETASVDHKELVSALAYSESGNMVAMAGPRNVRLWSVTSSSVVHTFRINSLCIAVAFGNNDSVLWAALRNNVLLCWNVETGDLHTEPINWTADFEVQGSELHARAPQMGVFCMQMGVLAIVYRGEDLIIWDLDEERVYDIYEKDTGSRLNGSSKEVDGITSVSDVAFSATPEANLIAAAFSDGDLVVYNMDEGTVGNTIVAAYPQTLCCSPDGRTLACGDSRGNVILYDFETLRMLYKIQFQGDAVKIRSLAFTPDDLRLIEIRGNQCRIWEPSVLLRQDSDDTSNAVSNSTAPLEIEYDVTGTCDITAIANAVTLPLVFCGKEDGAVYAYDVARDSQGLRLFVQTTNCGIILLHFDPLTDILTCCDWASRVTSRRVSRNLGGDWEISNILLDTRPAIKVSQLLSSSIHRRLLLSTIEHDTLWPLDESCEPVYVNRIAGSDNVSWVSHSDTHKLIRVEKNTASMFSWTNLEQLVTISFDSVDPSVTLSIFPLQHHRFFATVTKGRSSRDAQSAILVWDMNDFSTTEPFPTVKPAFDLGTLAVRVEQPIGMINDRFIFLDQDYWVCSIDLSHVRDISNKHSITTGSAPGLRASRRQSAAGATKEPSSAEPVIVRHFFVPYDWISMVTKIQVDILARGEIIFVKRSELVVVRRGLEVSETGPFRSLRGSRQMRLPTRPPSSIVPGRDRHLL